MKKQSILPLLALAGGMAAFVLRLLQNRTGFEAATGLPVPGNMPGLALIATLEVLALVFLLLVRSLPREAGSGPAFPAEFSAGSAGQVFLPVTGALLMLLSGLAEPLGAVLAWTFLRGFLTPGLLNGVTVVVAGIMLWVSWDQLLPQAKGRAGLLGTGAGCLLMVLGIAALQ